MNTVVVLGAGATKACGGPLTTEILPGALEHFRGSKAANLVAEFLVDQFGIRRELLSDAGRYPSLPLLLSLLDTAIIRGETFRPGWPVERVREVRESVEEVVFLIVEEMTQGAEAYHEQLVAKLGDSPTVVSLNYDLLIDYALMRASGGASIPDYGCDVATPVYRENPHCGTLLKIHGSLNWLYCPACQQLEVRRTGSGAGLQTPLRPLATEEPCPGLLAGKPCGTKMRRVLITPSHSKDYRNPHIASVWRRAEDALRGADEAFLIGYSLPWDDVEVIYLLKRGLAHLEPEKITVIEQASDAKDRDIRTHSTGKRYLAVFGDVGWRYRGFEDWLKHG